MTATAAAVSVRGITKQYDDRPILHGVDAELPIAAITAILGPSGSGKSTLLRILAGLTEPDAGQVTMRGTRVIDDGEPTEHWPGAAKRIGMVFQNYTLWPHLDVLANLTLAPRKRLGLSREEATARAEAVLEEVGLRHHLRSAPAGLSGGERQRVAIARAVMMGPELLLCDEITSALDRRAADDLLGVLQRLQHTEELTVALVTHDLDFASRAADHLVLIEHGRVADAGPRAELMAQSGPVRTFMRTVD